MTPLLVNSQDISGGAARAAYRLHQGLLRIGLPSDYLAGYKASDDHTVSGPRSRQEKALLHLIPHLDMLPLRFYPHRQQVKFSSNWFPGTTLRRIQKMSPDVVHLQWVGGGFVKIEDLAKIRKPVVWTLHDMWAFTGGCHYDKGCGRYQEGCGNCPILGSEWENDLSVRILGRKKASWDALKLTVVGVSRWMADCAKKSSLFKNRRIEVIPNGLDTQRYKPMNKAVVRDILSFPQDKKLILFGASVADARKGFRELTRALEILSSLMNRSDTEVVIFGSSQPPNAPDFGFQATYTGHLHDDISLAMLYAASDVMVVPSLQEAFGQTASEAMACGTPVVAFDTTGLKDIVDHGVNGYLARAFDPGELAKGIVWVLDDGERWNTLSHHARKKAVQDFSIETVAKKYAELYADIL